MSSAEITRGDFIYRDTLFIDLGPTKRHPRASDFELRNLLLPKRSTSPIKDQVAHYYEAQLLHYRLPRTKDKNAAKVRLTQALSSGALGVPASIAQMEKDMRKEWLAAIKREGKALGPSAPASRKRKADDDAVASKGSAVSTKRKIKVTVELDVSDVEEVPAPKAKAVKKLKTEPVSTTGKSKAKPTVTKPTSATKPATPAKMSGVPYSTKSASKTITAKVKANAITVPDTKPAAKSPIKRTLAPKPTKAKAETGSATMPKQTARYSGPPRGGGIAGGAPGRSTPQSYDPGDYHLSDYVSSDSESDAPPPYSAYDFSASQPRSSNNATVQVSGTYSVHHASTTSRDFHYPHLTIRLDKTTSSPTLWGVLIIHSEARIVFTTESPSSAINGSRAPVQWRMEDLETGHRLFRRDCMGELGFDGRGGVDLELCGVLNGDDLRVEGDMDEDQPMDGEVWGVEEIRGEWGAIARRAYGGRVR